MIARLYRLTLSSLLLLAATAFAQPTNLSGTWTYNGINYEVKQDGDKITAVGQTPWTEAELRAGDVEWHGTLQGKQLTGKQLVVRLNTIKDIATKKRLCGDRWKFFAELRLTLSEDGQQLQGEWRNETDDQKTCAATGKNNWVPISFTRKPPPAPAVVPPAAVNEPSNKGTLMAGLAMLAAAAMGFFFRNAYVNYLVSSLKRSPNSAGLAGWALYGGLLFASAIGSVALANSSLLTPMVIGGLGALSLACFGLCAVLSGKR